MDYRPEPLTHEWFEFWWYERWAAEHHFVMAFERLAESSRGLVDSFRFLARECDADLAVDEDGEVLWADS